MKWLAPEQQQKGSHLCGSARKGRANGPSCQIQLRFSRWTPIKQKSTMTYLHGTVCMVCDQHNQGHSHFFFPPQHNLIEPLQCPSALHLVNIVIWSVVFSSYILWAAYDFPLKSIPAVSHWLLHLAFVPLNRQSPLSIEYASIFSFFRQAASANAKRKFCLEYSQSYQHKTGYPSFSSIPQFKTKTTKKEKKLQRHSPYTNLPNSSTSLRPSVLCFLWITNSPTYPPPSPCSLSVFMAASHTISCSPALFADGRDERDGAGWLLGYWALSTNGRPWQGRFHAPPPRRQPSEQHSHFSTLSLSMFFPLCVCSSSPVVGKDQIHKGLTLCSKACRCGYRNPCWSMFRKRFLENQNNNWQMTNMAALVVGSSLHWADQSTKSNQ